MATQSDVDVALARPGARVHAASAASLSVRWQVRGGAEGVVPIRPGVGGAASLAESTAARSVEAAFEGAGWRLTLEGEAGRTGGELWARACRD